MDDTDILIVAASVDGQRRSFLGPWEPFEDLVGKSIGCRSIGATATEHDMLKLR